jgi:AcrR family transcriptional regulator
MINTDQPAEPVVPATSRRERRKQEFRDKIMEAAIALFELQGCEATTLESICERADVSRPTFYKYYPSKQDLIKALAETLWLKLAEELTSESMARAESTAQYIASFFELIRREFAKYTRLERDLVCQSMINDPHDIGSASVLAGLTALFEGVYRAGLERGDLGSHYPVDFLAEMTMGAINAVMMNWAIDEAYPLDLRLDQLADYLPRMLGLS